MKRIWPRLSATERCQTIDNQHQNEGVIRILAQLHSLHLIAEGHTNQEIANELFIVTGMVKAHASNIYGKLNVDNRTEAVARAKELDLL